jgi:hypothetical protein
MRRGFFLRDDVDGNGRLVRFTLAGEDGNLK